MKRILVVVVLIAGVITSYSQSLELHGNKDFATFSTANHSWGAGVSLSFDEWVSRLSFKINFDWLTAKPDAQYGMKQEYQKYKYGLSVHYGFPVMEKVLLQVGGAVSFDHLQNMTVYSEDSLLSTGVLNVLNTGYYVGLGIPLSFRYSFTPRCSFSFNVIPEYQILVSNNCTNLQEEPLFDKGYFFLQIQAGFVFKLTSE